jgi:quercetin dioxygenase-like cupin family protein
MLQQEICIVNNMWVKQMHFEKKGDIKPGHSHIHDHQTLLAKGSVRVAVEDVVKDFKAPHIIFIGKEKKHHLIALEDDTVAYCIHPLTPDMHDGEDLVPNASLVYID